MKILYTRHGQTDWNILKKVQGIADIELNDKGIEQAYRTKEKLSNEDIDLIICSPLKRVIKTAEIINEGRNIKVKYDKRLLEINYGENEGKTAEEFDYNGFWSIENTHLYKDAEDVNDLIKRVFEFFDELKNLQNKNILIVAHNGVYRAVNSYFKGFPEDNDIKKYEIQNCEVVEYKL